MVLVPGKVILDAAVKSGWGVPALNINEMLQLQAYMNAAYELNSPLILQASMGSRKFTGWLSAYDPDPDLGAKATMEMIRIFDELYQAKYDRRIPIAVTLDHGPNPNECKSAVDAGFGMVMIDGSLNYGQKDAKGKHPPNTYEQNVAVTKQVVDYAHKKGVTVEGELGTLGGIEDETAATQVKLTDPNEAGRFVKEILVDCLAVAIGTSHGAYKFLVAPKLALDLVPKIYDTTNIPLVMHGSSSVPIGLVALVNEFPVVHISGNVLEIAGYFSQEGQQKVETRRYQLDNPEEMAKLGVDLKKFSCLKKSMGVPMEQIQQAIEKGHVAKINVDTDGRLGTTGKIRETMAKKPDVFDQRVYFEAARKEGLYQMAVEKMRGFGSAGKADSVEIITLEDMAIRYAT